MSSRFQALHELTGKLRRISILPSASLNDKNLFHGVFFLSYRSIQRNYITSAAECPAVLCSEAINRQEGAAFALTPSLLFLPFYQCILPEFLPGTPQLL